MARKKMKLYNDYFIQAELSDQQIMTLEKIHQMERIEKLKTVLQDSGKLAGRPVDPEYILKDAQTKAVGMAVINPTFFIGDKPGLGKTVMSAAIYATLRKKALEKGEKIGKMLLITDNNHVIGMTNELRKCGINLQPLNGGTAKINKILKTYDIDSDETDGIATTWSSLTINGFLMYYLEIQDKIFYGAFDETSALKNEKTVLFEKAKAIADRIPRKVFLNGSTFETTIFDIFNQFKVLNEAVLPVKKFLQDNYVVMGKNSWYESEFDKRTGQSKPVMRFSYRVADYKNQSDLKNRLKYFYVARTKADYSNDLPARTYTLHPVELTTKMKKHLAENGSSNYDTVLNSPTTVDKEAKFNNAHVPKLEVLTNLFESIASERPVIYCFHRESQKEIKAQLKKLGYRVEIINGEIDSAGKQKILDEFKEGFYDGLIINVKKALNVYGSHAMIFYNILNNPQATYQLMGRIDRNNYKDDKQYHFLVYLDSPEMFNMVDLAYFREEHSSEFTGQYEEVYKQLIKQLENYIAEE